MKSAILRITKVCVRHYNDNGQTKAYVEWIGHRGQRGRTEAEAHILGDKPGGQGWLFTTSEHMASLIERAQREGVEIERETW